MKCKQQIFLKIVYSPQSICIEILTHHASFCVTDLWLLLIGASWITLAFCCPNTRCTCCPVWLELDNIWKKLKNPLWVLKNFARTYILILVAKQVMSKFCNTCFASLKFDWGLKQVLGKFYNTCFVIFKVWKVLYKESKAHNMGFVQHIGCWDMWGGQSG